MCHEPSTNRKAGIDFKRDTPLADIKTTPFKDQKPGTSGLRKKVAIFKSAGYLENFVQSIFDVVDALRGGTLVLGGDGRYYNDSAIQIILAMAAANGVSKCIVGQEGLFSTPAVSNIIRKYSAQGGIILSASHNPGGPDGDFGIKFNSANGGSASEAVTKSIFENSKTISRYKFFKGERPDLSKRGTSTLGDMAIEIIDPVSDYVELMESLFDFPAIKNWIARGSTICFDAMHAITGPYAKAILVDRLGAPQSSLMNAVPLPDFGGHHPDPNPIYAKDLFDKMFAASGPDFGAASDGDGDRNIILGNGIFVSPSDSVAVLAANAHLVPAYEGGIVGVARSMPTSGALDRVAQKLGIEYFETPTGWKFFGNLLDAGRITICGEESAGTSSSHVREKDGLWAVLMWMNILAVKKQTVKGIMSAHWREFGRNFYARHDYDAVDSEKAHAVMDYLRGQLGGLPGRKFGAETVKFADSFTYLDPIDGSVSENQGLRVGFESGSRFVMRLSGTGTVGATLRLYVERYSADPDILESDNHTALESIVKIAKQLTDISRITGREKATLVS